MAYAIESEYNMKRTLVLFTIILNMVFCSACGNSKKENDMVKYESGNYHDKNWSETIGTYGGMVIPDEETALKIAKAIFDGIINGKTNRKYIICL